MWTAEGPSSYHEGLSAFHSSFSCKKRKNKNEKCIIQSSDQSQEHTKFTKNELVRLHCYWMIPTFVSSQASFFFTEKLLNSKDVKTFKGLAAWKLKYIYIFFRNSSWKFRVFHISKQLEAWSTYDWFHMHYYGIDKFCAIIFKALNVLSMSKFDF